MRLFTLFACLSVLLLAATCKSGTKASAEMKQLERTWLHAHEEDEGDIRVYRPNTYAFPPSRGRTGFAFDHNGLFTQFDIAPTDLLDKDWHFARRPDSLGFMAYRVTPIPSRLIDGFLFSSNGTFVRHTFAPNDAPLDIPGTWSTLDGQLFHITPNNNQQAQYDIRIGTLTPTTLRAQVQY